MRVIITADGREILLPKNDFLFKLIFGDERNKKLLKSFLQAVLELPDDEFDIVFLDTHLKQEFSDDKLCVIDIRIKTKTGKQIDIEMQMAPTANLFERICYYKAKMLLEQIGMGENYDKLKKVIRILVADFCFVDGGDPTRYHHCYRQCDNVDETYFGDVEEIHVLELPKLPKDSDKTLAWDWAKFIGAETEEELDMIAAQSEVMKTAVSELYRVSSDADVRLQYELREKARRDAAARELYLRQIEDRIRQGEDRIRQGEDRIRQGEDRIRQDEDRIRQDEDRIRQLEDKFRTEGEARATAKYEPLIAEAQQRIAELEHQLVGKRL
jgi:predicted transposase/invertase (TIGR01784 family)